MPHIEKVQENSEAAAALVEVSGAPPHMLVAFRRVLSLRAEVQSTLLAFLHLAGDPQRVDGRLEIGDGAERRAVDDAGERITLVLTAAAEAAH